MISCQVLAIDMRGHGDSKTHNDENLSAETQAEDVVSVVKHVFGSDPPPIVLIGHSMGGAIAVHATATEQLPTIAGLIVIDVVEGTAMEALASMQSFLRSKPKHFHSLEQAIEWRYVSYDKKSIKQQQLLQLNYFIFKVSEVVRLEMLIQQECLCLVS